MFLSQPSECFCAGSVASVLLKIPPHTAALLLQNKAHSGFYYRCLVFGAASAFCSLVKNEQLMLTRRASYLKSAQ